MRNYSSRFPLPNGKWAYIQLNELTDAARKHVARIRRLWQPPEYFFHLRNGGHVAALREHLPNGWYGKVDLSSFFSNITRNRVTRSLTRIGYSFRDAEEFAVASTVCVKRSPRRFALPYGFVQSPLLASVALDKSELGNCFRRLVSRGVTTSVYVDDIVVSAITSMEVNSALSDIRLAARISHFPINEAKSRGSSARMQAFNIDFDLGGMEIARPRYEEMCQMVLQSGAGQVSQGILGYVRTVSTAQADQIVRGFPRSFPGTQRPQI